MTIFFLLDAIAKKGTVVKQYEPRSVRVKHYLAEFERNFRVEHNLSVLSGKPKSDQTLYQVTLADGNEFVLFFCDSRMLLGVGVRDWES